MELVHSSRSALCDYVAAQVGHFFPDGAQNVSASLARDIDETLDRLQRCIAGVRLWPADRFDYLHSSQYTLFLYYFANTIWRNRENERLCSKLFYLNKTLNGIDCFYMIDMPDIWFVGHSVGIVLARTRYANYFAVYQNATVGKNHGDAPTLGEGVVLYPNSAIIGACTVGARTYVAQGSAIVNRDTPGNCLVFGRGPDLVLKPAKRDILADIFRL